MNKKGYTIVEGLVAMLLVAIMVGGIFSALMASRRAIIEPSYKEEMIYAVESLENQLKAFVSAESTGNLLCGSDTPLAEGVHDCTSSDFMPAVCSSADSALTYEVLNRPVAGGTLSLYDIKIHITCNGEVL